MISYKYSWPAQLGLRNKERTSGTDLRSRGLPYPEFVIIAKRLFLALGFMEVSLYKTSLVRF